MKKASDVSVYVLALLTALLMQKERERGKEGEGAEAFFLAFVSRVGEISRVAFEFHRLASRNYCAAHRLHYSSLKCFRRSSVFPSSRIKFELPLALRLTAILFSRGR